MNGEQNFDVVIIGGGLAGLTSAIMLASANVSVLLIEKKTYPFHKVCGEYISNEVRPFLERIGLDLSKLGVAEMNRFRISDRYGNCTYAYLEMGGFGISRYTLDQALYQLAVKKGANFLLNSVVKDVQFDQHIFKIILGDNSVIKAKFVFGTYGKRALLDKQLKRKFVTKRTGYMAVKYHIKTNHPINEIGLDNFQGGYCGISKIEGDLYCLCYLVKRKNMKGLSSIREMESAFLYKNPFLKNIFQCSDFIDSKPEVINEIYFSDKEQIVNHVMMVGDAAGLITPLCGNGMSMAIHGAKMLCELLLNSGALKYQVIPENVRLEIESNYCEAWKKAFKTRLITGRIVQQLFLLSWLSTFSLFIFKRSTRLQQWVIRRTHGQYL